MTRADVLQIKHEYSELNDDSDISLKELVDSVTERHLIINDIGRCLTASDTGMTRTKYKVDEINEAIRLIAIQAIKFIQSGNAKKVIKSQFIWVTTDERLPYLVNGGGKYASSDDLLLLDRHGYYHVGWFRSYHFEGKEVFVLMDGRQVQASYIKEWAIIRSKERCESTY